MAQKIQADYASLEQAAKQFSQHADRVSTLRQQIVGTVERLESGHWIGVGAGRFFAEMRELVFPALDRLNAALQDASQGSAKIAATFLDAEQEAGNLFRGDGAMSSAPLALEVQTMMAQWQKSAGLVSNLMKGLHEHADGCHPQSEMNCPDCYCEYEERQSIRPALFYFLIRVDFPRSTN